MGLYQSFFLVTSVPCTSRAMEFVIKILVHANSRYESSLIVSDAQNLPDPFWKLHFEP